MLEVTKLFRIDGRTFEIGQIVNESEIPAVNLKKMLSAGEYYLKNTTIATPKRAGIVIPKKASPASALEVIE